MSSRDSTSTSTNDYDLSPIAPYLYLSAAILVVGGIAFGFLLTPIAFVLVAVGVIDGVLAFLFKSGAIRGQSDSDDEAAAIEEATADDDAARVEADPSYNPYARED
jgi:hypothetical protein